MKENSQLKLTGISWNPEFPTSPALNNQQLKLENRLNRKSKTHKRYKEEVDQLVNDGHSAAINRSGSECETDLVYFKFILLYSMSSVFG